MAEKLTCAAKIRACSPPMGVFWQCPACSGLICNNCMASRGNNQCPMCKKPVVLKKVQ